MTRFDLLAIRQQSFYRLASKFQPTSQDTFVNRFVGYHFCFGIKLSTLVERRSFSIRLALQIVASCRRFRRRRCT